MKAVLRTVRRRGQAYLVNDEADIAIGRYVHCCQGNLSNAQVQQRKQLRAARGIATIDNTDAAIFILFSTVRQMTAQGTRYRSRTQEAPNPGSLTMNLCPVMDEGAKKHNYSGFHPKWQICAIFWAASPMLLRVPPLIPGNA